MKRTTHLLALAFVLCSLASCGPAIKKFVNAKYPPVSPLERSAAAVQSSMSELGQLSKADLGVRVDEAFLDSTMRAYFSGLYAASPNLGLAGVSGIDTVRAPQFSTGRQALLTNAELRFHLADNKYLRSVTIAFEGMAAPSMSNDSLRIAPAFERIRITGLKLKKFRLFGRAAKNAINALVAGFRDNINGQIQPFAMQINYPPFPEIPLSSLLGAGDGVQVTNDYTFRLSRKTLHPVILVKPGSLSVLATIDEVPATAARVAAFARVASLPQIPQPDYQLQPSSSGLRVLRSARMPASLLRTMAVASVSPQDFDQLYARFDSAFAANWNTGLDTITVNESGTSVRLSYDALGRITNELLRDARFGLDYAVDANTEFPDKMMSLGEINKPDCNSITFDCQYNNCSNVLSDCGSCRWYDGLCHVRWAACQTANGVKWAACQASNAAKTVWCAGELAVRRGLCYTELAAIFIYDNLIKDVGTFGGFARANGHVVGTIGQTVPNGISSLTLNGRLQARMNAEVGIRFSPSGLLGHLACFLPVNETFQLNDISVDQPISLHADIQRIQQADNCQLKVGFQKTRIELQLSEPLLLEILSKPDMVLKCGIGIGLGLTVTSTLALLGNENFKNYLRAALIGSYYVDFEQQFNMTIPPMPIGTASGRARLMPSWGERSIVFTKK